jgi:PleD family two-component response regulator
LFQEFQKADNAITAKRAVSASDSRYPSASLKCTADGYGSIRSLAKVLRFLSTLPVRVETAGRGRMSKRILVVEDHADNRQIIRDMLVGTDYEITEAETGEEALAAIAKQRPDLILMDIQLPTMDDR